MSNTAFSSEESGWESDERDLWSLYEYRTHHSPLPLLVTEGPDHIIRYANPAFCVLSGKSSQELKGVCFAKVLPQKQGNGCLALLDRVFDTRVTESITSEVHGKAENPTFWGYSVWSIIDEDHCPPGVMIQVADVSEEARTRKRATDVGGALLTFGMEQQDALELSAMAQGRLELSIRETEHRAKNSLQTISSRLNIELRKTPVAVPALEIQKLQLHVKTIAVMHDLLATVHKGSGSSQTASIKQMLHRLLPMWETIAGAGRFELSSDDIELPLRECTSLVTAVNELVCNAVKHGAERVILELKRERDLITLAVSDDGKGFPKDFDPNAAGFGLRFVDSIAKKEFNGRISYENLRPGGASVKIIFQLKDELQEK